MQLGHEFGAGRVIATASNEDKRALALELGADVAIDPGAGGADRASGRGQRGRAVDVVFEMSGGEVFDASYTALAPFGRIVVCGIATSEAQQGLKRIAAASLARRSSASICFTACERPGMFAEALADLFARAAAGPASCGDRRAHLSAWRRRAQAQIDLRARRTTGKLLLDPSA